MGTNVSKSVQQINQEINQKLSQVSTVSANADCGIKTGKIILKNADNCKIVNKNYCNVTAGNAIDTAIEAATKAFQDASKEQKAAMLPGLNANSTTQQINTAIRSELEQKCGTDSRLRNQIISDDIIYDGCKNSTIDNINTGDIYATCGIRAIMKAAETAQNVEKEKQETTGLNLFGGLSNWVVIVIVVIILIVIGLGVWYFFSGSSMGPSIGMPMITIGQPPMVGVSQPPTVSASQPPSVHLTSGPRLSSRPRLPAPTAKLKFRH
ncbi:MAG: L1 family membrane protein [candidate division WOR-3 bacterium]